MKRREYWLRGEAVPMAVLQLPLSEGIVDPRYKGLGTPLLQDALRRQPMLLAIGMGGREQEVVRLLRRHGWQACGIPFYFRVIRSASFLRNIEYCRDSALVRAMLDVLAFTGLGPLAIGAVQRLYRPSGDSDPAITVEVVDAFEDWADELWTAQREQYGLCPFRDAETLRILYPRENPRFIRLKVVSKQGPIGWAVVIDTRHHGHKHFGKMRLGSLVDAFLLPRMPPGLCNARYPFWRSGPSI